MQKVTTWDSTLFTRIFSWISTSQSLGTYSNGNTLWDIVGVSNHLHVGVSSGHRKCQENAINWRFDRWERSKANGSSHCSCTSRKIGSRSAEVDRQVLQDPGVSTHIWNWALPWVLSNFSLWNASWLTFYRISSVPKNQLMMQKLVINKAYEMMGIGVTQTLATLMDG